MQFPVEANTILMGYYGTFRSFISRPIFIRCQRDEVIYTRYAPYNIYGFYYDMKL